MLSWPKMEKNIKVHCVQRHDFLTVTNEPRTGPNAGPRNGLKIYNADGPARFSIKKTSARVPAPIARVGEYARPAKKRRMQSDQIF